MQRWSDGAAGLVFGSDYNPEQWPAEVRADDVRLMQRAGVNLVSVGIFSWGLLEPRPGRFDFGWFDAVLDDLHAGGIGVSLATATASPPAWLGELHPEVLPVDADGHRVVFGSRQSWCPSSPVYRERSLALVEALAERYGQHPALRLWHVSNELGCHNARCYCDVSAAAFRTWLADRYPDVAALNDAWATAFWSQHYTSFEQVQVPARTSSFHNPAQALDFARFSSDELLGQHLAEKDVLRRVTPEVPVTTNFMIGSQLNPMDYGRWAREQDVVANDHYLIHGNYDDPRAELAYSADLTRGTASGQPWLLMEHSTSAVNWQPVNVAKPAGEMLQDSLSHVARGADGICFFQWRASAGGAEQWHSALVPHAGEDTERFREVTELGALLGRLGELRGSTTSNDVAILVDWQNAWAMESETLPSRRVGHADLALRVHGLLREARTGADVVPVGAHPHDLAEVLAGYRVLVVPTLYLCDDTTAAAVTAAAESGTHVLVTYFSGIVDETARVRLGGYPGAFRDLLGIRVEEFHPLPDGVAGELDDATVGDVWSEIATADDDVEVLSRYAEGATAGCPALTRRDLPSGARAWYLGTSLDDEALAGLLHAVCTTAGVAPVAEASGPVDVVRRRAADGRSWLFALNHGEEPATVTVRGFDLVAEVDVDGLDLEPGASAVVRELGPGD
ncbi:beta-galactosidase [Kineococcus radiotolerans]|uniref:Beta-galactosidase n=1 Tax=Kineococcus radiotolerans (strain ATCC BAA-149 / DSM 14245 / SRS30216) TaxID=266940 RepID=A6WF44_KINRD|nr:beta-galactosidase [Kineococcus radiotolerans]ABS05433.1 Beta-galactosidase [Kineococcus radiotolerans SRS30216 = ATCC BAA-149]